MKDKQPNRLFKEGDVWWRSIGINVSVEIFGKGKYFARPVVIFKKFDENSFLGIPLTTQPKTGTWYVPFIYAGKQQYAILSQARTFDSRRLRDKIGSLPEDNFKKIKISFANFYTSENSHPASLPAKENNAGISG